MAALPATMLSEAGLNVLWNDTIARKVSAITGKMRQDVLKPTCLQSLQRIGRNGGLQIGKPVGLPDMISVVKGFVGFWTIL